MILNIVLYLFFTVGGLVFIKMGSDNVSISIKSPQINLSLNYYVILGLTFYVVSFLLWTALLKGNKLSYIFPITTGLSQILVLLSSVAFFNERLTPMKIIAVMVIVIGVVLLNVQK